MPEFYNLAQQDCVQGREGYPLRPGRTSSLLVVNALEPIFRTHRIVDVSLEGDR